jgi:hypothetical protein
MNFKLTPKLMEDLLNYLSAKPWMEANKLISELIKLEKINENDTSNAGVPAGTDNK